MSVTEQNFFFSTIFYKNWIDNYNSQRKSSVWCYKFFFRHLKNTASENIDKIKYRTLYWFTTRNKVKELMMENGLFDWDISKEMSILLVKYKNMLFHNRTNMLYVNARMCIICHFRYFLNIHCKP